MQANSSGFKVYRLRGVVFLALQNPVPSFTKVIWTELGEAYIIKRTF